MTDDPRLRAIVSESLRNERNNPALEAEQRYKPSQWTDAQTAELMERLHGDERERIDRLVSEHNERMRRS